jgi:hypothetical protein
MSESRKGRRLNLESSVQIDYETALNPMLTKDQSHEIFSRIRKFSSADEVEVYISGGRSALTRFANNMIHQNVADENHAVSRTYGARHHQQAR